MRLKTSNRVNYFYFCVALFMGLVSSVWASDLRLSCHNPYVSGDEGRIKIHYTESGKIVLSWKTVQIENERFQYEDASKYEISIFSVPIHVDGIGVQSENFQVVDPILVDPVKSANRYEQVGESSNGTQMSPQYHYIVIDLLDLLGKGPEFPGYSGNQGGHYLDKLYNDQTFIVYLSLRATNSYTDSDTLYEPVLDEQTGQQVSQGGHPVSRPVKEYHFEGAPYGALFPIEVRVNLGNQMENIPEELKIKVLEPVSQNKQYYYREKARQPVQIGGQKNSEYLVKVGADLGENTEEADLSNFDVVSVDGIIQESYDIAIYEDRDSVVDLAIVKAESGTGESIYPRYPLYEIQVSKWPGFFYPSRDAVNVNVNGRYFSKNERVFFLSQTSWVQLPQGGFDAYVDSQGEYIKPFAQVELSLKETIQAWDTKKGDYQFKRVYYGTYKGDFYGRGKEEKDKGYYYLRVRAHGQEVPNLITSVLNSLKRLFVPSPYQVSQDALTRAIAIGNDLIAGVWSDPVAIKVNRSFQDIPALQLTKVTEAQPDVVRIPLKWQYKKAPNVSFDQATNIEEVSPENPNLSHFLYEVVGCKEDGEYHSKEGRVPHSDTRSSIGFVLREDRYKSVSRDYIDQENLLAVVESLKASNQSHLYYFMKNFYEGNLSQQFNYDVDKKLFSQYSLTKSQSLLFQLNKSIFNYFYPDSASGSYDVVVRPLVYQEDSEGVQSLDFIPAQWSNKIDIEIGTPDGSVPMAFLRANYVGLSVNPTEPRILPLYWRLGAYNQEGNYEEAHPLDVEFAYNQNTESENSESSSTKRVASYLLYVYKSGDSPILLNGQLPFIDEDSDGLNDYTELISYDENEVSSGHTGKAVGVFYFTTADIDDFLSSQQEVRKDRYFQVSLNRSYVPVKNESGEYIKDENGNIQTVQKENIALEEGVVLKAFLLPIAHDGVQGKIARGVKYTYRANNFLDLPLSWSISAMDYDDSETNEENNESFFSIYRYPHIRIVEGVSVWGPYSAFASVTSEGGSNDHLSQFEMPNIVDELTGDYQFVAVDTKGVEKTMTSSYMNQLLQRGVYPLIWRIDRVDYFEKAENIKEDEDQVAQIIDMRKWVNDIWLTKEEQGKEDVQVDGYYVYVYYAPEGETPVDPRVNPEEGLDEMNYIDDNNNRINDYTEVIMEVQEMTEVVNHAYASFYINKKDLGKGTLSDPYAWLNLNIRKWVKRYPNDIASDEYVALRSSVKNGNYHVYIQAVSHKYGVTDLSDPLVISVNKNQNDDLEVPRLYDPETEIEKMIQEKKEVLLPDSVEGEEETVWVDVSLKEKQDRLREFKNRGYLPITWEIKEDRIDMYEILVSQVPIQGTASKAIKEYTDEQGVQQNVTYFMDRSDATEAVDYGGYYSLDIFQMDDKFYNTEENVMIKPFFLKDLKQERYFARSSQTFETKEVQAMGNSTYYIRARASQQIPIVTNGRVESLSLLSQWSNQVDMAIESVGQRAPELSAEDVEIVSSDVIEVPLHWTPISEDSVYYVETVKYYHQGKGIGVGVINHQLFDNIHESYTHKDYVMGENYIEEGHVWKKNLIDSSRDLGVNIHNPYEYYLIRLRSGTDKIKALYIQNEDSLWSNIVLSQIYEDQEDRGQFPEINLKSLVPSIDQNGVLVIKWIWGDHEEGQVDPDSVTRYQMQINPIQGENEEDHEEGIFMEKTYGDSFSKITKNEEGVYRYITSEQILGGSYRVRVRAVQYQENGNQVVSSWSNEQEVVVKGLMVRPEIAVYSQESEGNIVRLENIEKIISKGQGMGILRIIQFNHKPNTNILPINSEDYEIHGIYQVSNLNEGVNEIAVPVGYYYVAQLWNNDVALTVSGSVDSTSFSIGEDGLPIDSNGGEISVSSWSQVVYSGNNASPLEESNKKDNTLLNISNWQGTE